MSETKKTLNKPILTLVGLNGNAFNLMAQWQRAAKKAGWPKEEIQKVIDECMSDDYDHLLFTLMSNCEDVDTDEDRDEDDE